MNYGDLFIESKLPKPLTQAEIYDYFEKYKSGDETAREIIIKHNIRLVIYQVVKKFGNTPYDKKELVSIGLIGLVKSVDTFDTSKNLKFATYSTKCIDNEILMFIRKGKKYINDDSLDRTLSTDKNGNETKIKDTLYDENSDFVSDYEKKESYVVIHRVIENLPERDKEIIMLHFGFIDNLPLTQKQIADKLNISQSYVSKLVKKILKKRSLQLNNEDIVETTLNNTANGKLSKDKTDKEGEMGMPKRIQSIYEYFNKYTREQIDEMLSKLTDEEKELIELRYGSDLDNPVSSNNWTRELTNKFYGSLIPKMRNLLSNPEYKKRTRKRISKKEIITPEIKGEQTVQEQQYNPTSSNKNIKVDASTNNSELSKDDYVKILELLRTPSFGQLMSVLSTKEAIIISLKLGYVDGKYFSTESIANFLNIEPEEIRETTKKVLLVYKENINQFIDTAIQVTTDQTTLKREKKHR